MNDEDDCVLVREEHELDEILSLRAQVIALVFASWCPFCTRFLPVFLSHVAKGEPFFLRIQDDDEKVADRYSIEVFPTVLFFEKGKVVRRLDGIPGTGLNEKQLTDFIELCK
ncbi:MAG: thioredoxin family protein [Syntrophales bacterium]|nr:thioredoxin family protein [Syntrophales bacterium]